MSLPCQSDSDCDPGLRCYISGWSLGPGLPIASTTPSLSSPDGGQGSACVPQWDVACTTGSDCGPGYTCSQSGGGFGGVYSCGKDQDAGEPSYATVTTVSCSAVPTPLSAFGDAALGGFQIPSICEAGTTCTKVSWNTCAAQQTGPCSVDSDCPSTWTCGCETNCDGTVLASSGACVMVCIPPNSDLFAGQVCFGAAEGETGGTNAPSADSGVVAASGTSPPPAGSSNGHGGCEMGSERTSGSWGFVIAGLLAMARWRPRRTRRAG